MPKRKNLSGDCSHLQYKQHVGVQEINSGITQQNNMKNIYGRTQLLVFNESKKSFIVPKDGNCSDIYVTDMHTDNVIDDVLAFHGEMQITCNSHCMTPTENTSNAFHVLTVAKKSSSQSCCQCCRGQAASQNLCDFCEKAICYDCVRSCSICNDHFCQLCSIMNPDDPKQHWYCQECSNKLHPHACWIH